MPQDINVEELLAQAYAIQEARNNDLLRQALLATPMPTPDELGRGFFRPILNPAPEREYVGVWNDPTRPTPVDPVPQRPRVRRHIYHVTLADNRVEISDENGLMGTTVYYLERRIFQSDSSSFRMNGLSADAIVAILDYLSENYNDPTPIPTPEPTPRTATYITHEEAFANIARRQGQGVPEVRGPGVEAEQPHGNEAGPTITPTRGGNYITPIIAELAWLA